MEDKAIFKLVNAIDKSEFKEYVEYKGNKFQKANLKKIKSRTFNQIGLFPYKTRKRRMAIVASIAILIMAISIIGPSSVYAGLQRAISYIPGFNIVVEEGSFNNYVITEKVVWEEGEYKIEVAGVYINGKQTIFTIRGVHPELEKEESDRFQKTIDEKMYLKNDGEVYRLQGYSMGMSNVSWEGTFTFERIKEPYNLELYYNDEIISQEISLTIPLKEATLYEDVNMLGPISTVNGITLIAIPNYRNSILDINLLNLGLENGRINSYTHEKIELVDEQGNSYPISHRTSFSSPLSEFEFDISKFSGESLKLIIPEIVVTYYDEVTVRLDTPTEDTLELNQDFLLRGYKSTIESLTKDDEGYLIMNVKPYKDDTIQVKSFMLDGMSYSSRMDEEMVEQSYRFVEKTFFGKQKVTFKNPRVRILGPWELIIK